MKLIIIVCLILSFSLWGQEQSPSPKTETKTNTEEARQIPQKVLDQVAKEMAEAKAANEAKEAKAAKDAKAVLDDKAPKGLSNDWVNNLYKSTRETNPSPDVVPNGHSENIKKTIAPFQAMSLIELENHIKITFKNSQYNAWFKKYPYLVTFIAELLRSPEALPQLAKILDKKDELAKVVITLLFTFVIGMILKRMVHPNAPFAYRVLHFFFRVFVLMILRIGTVIYFFQDELAPTWKLFNYYVLKKIFL